MAGLILIGIASIAFFFLIRNNRVFNEKRRILQKVSERADHDIANSNPATFRQWSCRYAEYNSISYDEMLYKFWKPVKSFYKNHSCIS